MQNLLLIKNYIPFANVSIFSNNPVFKNIDIENIDFDIYLDDDIYNIQYQVNQEDELILSQNKFEDKLIEMLHQTPVLSEFKYTITYKTVAKKKRNNLINDFNVIDMYTFDKFYKDETNYSNTAAYSRLIKASNFNLPEDGNIIYLFGDPGMGKSHLIHAFLHVFLNHRFDMDVFAISGNQLAEVIAEHFKSKTGSKLKKQLIDINVLIIDDLQYFIKCWDEGIIGYFVDIMNERYQNRFEKDYLTILVSDRQPDDFEVEIKKMEKKDDSKIPTSTKAFKYFYNSDTRSMCKTLVGSFKDKMYETCSESIITPKLEVFSNFFWTRFTRLFSTYKEELPDSTINAVDSIFSHKYNSERNRLSFRSIIGLLNKMKHIKDELPTENINIIIKKGLLENFYSERVSDQETLDKVLSEISDSYDNRKRNIMDLVEKYTDIFDIPLKDYKLYLNKQGKIKDEKTQLIRAMIISILIKKHHFNIVHLHEVLKLSTGTISTSIKKAELAIKNEMAVPVSNVDLEKNIDGLVEARTIEKYLIEMKTENV